MTDIRFNFRPSNGTEGEIFRRYTCDHCVHDHAWHNGEPEPWVDSCPIILDGLFGEHSYPNPDGPPQWFAGGPEHYGCTEYEGPCECGDVA